jgi:hypothetical protein
MHQDMEVDEDMNIEDEDPSWLLAFMLRTEVLGSTNPQDSLAFALMIY